MSAFNALRGKMWTKIGTEFLPFSDVATAELPLGRLLRLSLFQVSVGMAITLTIGTLNRVMIVELGVSTTLVSLMIGLPLIFAPFRALIGFKSDTHRSVLGWRRIPYMWFGTLLQFGGLAFMPFALLVLSGDNHAPVVLGQYAASLAFLLIGAGMQTTQTAGLALATDLADERTRPRVVALMYTMLLLGMVVSGFSFGYLLNGFTALRLIQVVQGAAALTMIMNVVALWKQEARDPSRTAKGTDGVPDFSTSWRMFTATQGAKRFLVAVGLGTIAFAMQDTLLEPYGGEILHLAVSQTTALTALMAIGSLIAFALAAHALTEGTNPYRLAAHGILVGLPAFACVLFAAPLQSPFLFCAGAFLIGFGMGMFSVGTLTAAMGIDTASRNGLALGAWGAVQATGAGVAIGAAGILRDLVSGLAMHGRLGSALMGHATGYGTVYVIEIMLLFASLAAIGPLVRHAPADELTHAEPFGLAQYPT
jgi:BCD family chlorophyll transporter-like MFS transporter